MFLTCNHFAVIYKSKAESLFTSLPPFIIIEDLRIYRVFFTHSSITQATQDDKQISKSIKRFFTRFHVSSALKVSNAYKKKGIPVTEIFQYRFMKMIQINWICFITILSSRIIKDAIIPLDSKDRANVLIIDDS